MTFQELLTSLGVTDDLSAKITDGMTANNIFTASEPNLGVRYSKLKGDHDAKMKELDAANRLIDELKKSSNDNQGLQAKIQVYESKILDLQKELDDVRTTSAIRTALIGAGAKDVDYMLFNVQKKLRENGETLAIDENGNIKGFDDRIDALKIQFPTQFENANRKTVEPNKLPDSSEPKGLTKSDILKLPYAERAKLAQDNSEAYHAAMTENN